MSEAAAEVLEYPYSYNRYKAKDQKISLLSSSLAEIRKEVAPLRFELAAKNIAKELDLRGGEKILELGSGLGLLGKAIQKVIGPISVNYFGIDLAFSSATESKNQSIEPVQASVTGLPFKNESFDAIVSTDVLEHIPDAKKAVEEIKRVLKPNGKAFLVIADPSEPRFEKVEGHIKRNSDRSDVSFWKNLFESQGLTVLEKESEKYRKRDWRKIFNLPFLVHLKDKPGLACAFNPASRPGVYIVKKIG